MPDPASELDPGYRALLSDFAGQVGLPFQPEAGDYGVEFESQGLVARLLPHPVRQGAVMVEVDALHLDFGPQGLSPVLAQTLLRMNALARSEHEWQLGLDGADTLVLWATGPTQTMSAGDLQELLADGLERARALADALAGVAANAGQATNRGSQALEQMVASGMVRG